MHVVPGRAICCALAALILVAAAYTGWLAASRPTAPSWGAGATRPRSATAPRATVRYRRLSGSLHGADTAGARAAAHRGPSWPTSGTSGR